MALTAHRIYVSAIYVAVAKSRMMTRDIGLRVTMNQFLKMFENVCKEGYV